MHYESEHGSHCSCSYVLSLVRLNACSNVLASVEGLLGTRWLRTCTLTPVYATHTPVPVKVHRHSYQWYKAILTILYSYAAMSSTIHVQIMLSRLMATAYTSPL